MRSLVLCVFTLAGYLFAEGPEFEVALIKPFDLSKAMAANGNRIGPASGGPGTNDPTHMTVPMMTLLSVLMQAFDVKNYQVITAGGPSPMFEFSLVLPEDSKKEDLKLMWRNLLISRFGLKYHIEQREFQVDELVASPRGHKLTENTEPEPPPEPNAQFPSLNLDRDGRPIMSRPGMISMISLNGGSPIAKMTARAQTLAPLVNALSNQLGHPVVDKTGLTGKYDFFVEYSPSSSSLPPPPPGLAAGLGAPAAPTPVTASEPGVDIATAVQQQLGLRLVKGKAMLDVVVVDKIERTPTEN